MQRISAFKTAAAAGVVALLLATCALARLMLPETPDPAAPAYRLQAYENTVALFAGEKIVTVYDGVVLSNLPSYDRALLRGGIPVESEAQADRLVEDYDG